MYSLLSQLGVACTNRAQKDDQLYSNYVNTVNCEIVKENWGFLAKEKFLLLHSSEKEKSKNIFLENYMTKSNFSRKT